jgi:hypothetical protein
VSSRPRTPRPTTRRWWRTGSMPTLS